MNVKIKQSSMLGDTKKGMKNLTLATFIWANVPMPDETREYFRSGFWDKTPLLISHNENICKGELTYNSKQHKLENAAENHNAGADGFYKVIALSTQLPDEVLRLIHQEKLKENTKVYVEIEKIFTRISPRGGGGLRDSSIYEYEVKIYSKKNYRGMKVKNVSLFMESAEIASEISAERFGSDNKEIYTKAFLDGVKWLKDNPNADLAIMHEIN